MVSLHSTDDKVRSAASEKTLGPYGSSTNLSLVFLFLMNSDYPSYLLPQLSKES